MMMTNTKTYLSIDKKFGKIFSAPSVFIYSILGDNFDSLSIELIFLNTDNTG